MPERALAVLGPPFALLAAQGIANLFMRCPGGRLLAVAAWISCGIASALVSGMVFHLPAGHVPGRAPFGWLHTEVITPGEADAIALIDGGEVLAPASLPPLYGDIIVRLRPGTTTVFGQGTFNFYAGDMRELASAVQAFFATETSLSAREAFLETWRVDYVFCPEIHPVDAKTLAALDAMPQLEPLFGDGPLRLYRVHQRTMR
jgi:hypothetical protein